MRDVMTPRPDVIAIQASASLEELNSLVVKTKFSRIPVYDKSLDDRFMAGLAAAGLRVEDIDFVMCTHLHADHVGWNTRLVDGRLGPDVSRTRDI